jgi:acetyl esterase/lipase
MFAIDLGESLLRNQLRSATTLLALLLMGPSCLAQQAPERFRRLDRNGDNRLTRDEVSGPVFDELDADHNNSVTVKEAIEWARRDGNGTGQRSSSAPPVRPQPGGTSRSQSLLNGFRVERNVAYANTENAHQRLDLFVPESADDQTRFPVVIYVHGGGWEGGNRDGGQQFIAPILRTRRYAVATIDYRLSGEAIWPAQIHDCKAAVRWIRANAKRWGCDEDKIAVLGTSAGGHLASMLGVTNDVPEFEGSVGPHVAVSSKVSCVIDFYGPSDLVVLGSPLGEAPSPISRLLGGSVSRRSDAARAASPVNHASDKSAPFLIIHGDRDSTVPLTQSELLHRALLNADAESYMTVVINGQHGYFGKPEVDQRCVDFLDRYLLDLERAIATSPVR